MSEGKGYVYVEEYPEYIRKHLISFNFSKTNTCAKRKTCSHTHVNTHNPETGKKKERESVLRSIILYFLYYAQNYHNLETIYFQFNLLLFSSLTIF